MIGHTPGPWKYDDDFEIHLGGEYIKRVLFDSQLKCVAEVHVATEIDDNDTPPEATQANARLIAAAPELLQTLQEAYRVLAESHMKHGELHWVTPGETLLERLSSVIEETTGQKPPVPSS